MRQHTLKSRSMAVAGIAATAMGLALAAPGAASANERWGVDATFTDGATVTGYFDFNVYGYISDWNLRTTAGPGFAAFDFSNAIPGVVGAGGGGPGSTSLTFYNGPTYLGDILVLNTSKSLTTTVGDNSLLATSYECVQNFDCPNNTPVRFLEQATTLAVPEPAAWSLMLVGFAVLGGAMRRRVRAVA